MKVMGLGGRLSASEPCGSVIDVGSSGLGGSDSGGGSGWCSWFGRGGAEGDGKGSVKFPGQESARGAVNKAMHSGAEGPAEDGVNGDFVAKGDSEEDRAAVRKGVREDVRNHSAEETVEIGRGEGVGVTDGAGETDGFEGLVSVVEVDERVAGVVDDLLACFV